MISQYHHHLTLFSILIVTVLSLTLIASTKGLQEQQLNYDVIEDLKSEDNNTTTSGSDEKDGTPVSCRVPLYRLPQRIQPHHYDLLIMPDIGSESFEGAVQISLSVNDDANTSDELLLAPNQIVLHADETLHIDHAWYLDQTNKSSSSSLGSSLKLNKVDSTLDQLLLETKPPKQVNGANRGSSSNSKDKEDDKDNGYVEVLNVCREPKYQLFVITLARNLEPTSRGLLHFTFTGLISKNPDHGLTGLYSSSWFATAAAGRNESGFNILTQFQPTHARKMFPCFDEPAMKATFELSLIYPADKTALANTSPIYERSLKLPTNINANANETAPIGDEEYKLVRYARTPPMSTYLLAFTVGDYEFLEGFVQLKTKKLRVRVYTAPSKLSRAHFALQTTLKAMKVLNRLFDGDEFPLDKIDLVAVRDFSEGAMENWGLITFREENFLFDPNNTSAKLRADIAAIIIHELAHQWFGNLVTMSWWNDIWLNEGFTTWIEYKILAQVYPELDHFYLFDSHLKALESDQMREARPIRQKTTAVLQGSHIEGLFDYVGYHKSASVIRMLENCFQWPNGFWPLVRNYIKLNRFKSVEFGDLIESLKLDKNLPMSIIETASSWVQQAGFPMVSLHLNGSRLHYEQKRLLKRTKGIEQAQNNSNSNSSSSFVDLSSQVWPIPVKASLFDGKKMHTHFYVLNQTRGSIELPNWWAMSPSNVASISGSNKWIKLNKDFDGFYVVQYSDEMFRSFGGSATELMRLSSLDRINLIEETLILFGSKRASGQRLLFLMMELSGHERHGSVFVSLIQAYDTLRGIFNRQNSTQNRAIEQFGQLVFGDIIFKQFAKEITPLSGDGNSSYWDSVGRSAVLERLVQLDYKPAVAKALQLYEESRSIRRSTPNRSQSVSVHLRDFIYPAVARRGSDEQFGRLMSMYEASNSLEHRLQLLRAMCRSDNRTRLTNVWKLLTDSTMDDRMLEQMEETKLECPITMTKDNNRIGRQFVLDLLAHNFTDIIDLNEGESIAPLLEELYLNSSPDEMVKLNEVVMKLEGDPVSDWPSYLEFILEAIEWRSDIREHSAASIESAWRILSSKSSTNNNYQQKATSS